MRTLIFLIVLLPCFFSCVLLGEDKKPSRPAKTFTVKEKAQRRMMKDLEIFNQEELVEINELYDDIHANYQTGGARKSFRDLVKKYPHS